MNEVTTQSNLPQVTLNASLNLNRRLAKPVSLR